MNKEDIHIDLHNCGYQFGDGIYGAAHVYNGVLFALDEHIDRLMNSAALIELDLRHIKDETITFCRGLVGQSRIENGYIYLQVTRSDGMLHNREFSVHEEQWSVFCDFAQSNTHSEEKMVKGADAVTVEDHRSLMCNVKSLNLPPNRLARHAAQKESVSKTTMVHDNIVTEERSGNIFIVEGDIALTHSNGGKVLPGIARQLVIKLLRQHNVPIQEKEFSKEELLHADEVMVTDTNSEIVPIIKVNDIIIGNDARDEITKKIQILYKSLIEEKRGKLQVYNHYGEEMKRCFFSFSVWRVYERIKKKSAPVTYCRNHIRRYCE